MLTEEVLARLTAPFAVGSVEVKPGSVRQDGTAALALAYADWRLYAARLDEAVGPANWSIALQPWGERRLIATLTLFGVSKSATGEGDDNDPNTGTIAEAQAKKRACAEFGLGRYLYFLPKIWGNGTGDRRSFRFAEGEAQRLVHAMYMQAGLIKPELRPRPTAAAAAPTPNPADDTEPLFGNAPELTTPARPTPPTLTQARTALATAEIHTGVAPTGSMTRNAAPPAAAPAPVLTGGSARQRAFIAQLQRQLGWDDTQLAAFATEHGTPLAQLTGQGVSTFIDALRQRADDTRPVRRSA